MSYYPEPNSPISDKVKVELDLTNYAVDTSNLAFKCDFIALKAEVDKLGINKLVNVSTSLNNLKTKVGDLDDGKLKTAPIDLKKISAVVSK